MYVRTIEIIDIECVLLSFLCSEKFVSTKWRIYKGILVGPRLLRRGISRGCREFNCFSTAKFANIFISRLKMEKKFYKEEKVSKNPF